MKYNTTNEAEYERALDYLKKLAKTGSLVEVKKISPKRSLNQNNYLHLLLGAFGEHFGYTLEEAKLIYKDLNISTFTYEKKGRKFYRSSADLDSVEMTKTIDRFKQASATHGYPLPDADDMAWLREIDNAIEQTKAYL